MFKLTSVMRKFRCESGATLIEYGVALIVAILMGGTSLSLLAEQSSNNIESASAVLDPDQY